MFLDILKFFLKMWSQICQQKADVSTKLFLEKSAATKNNKKLKKNIKAILSMADNKGHNKFFLWIAETTFAKQFSLKNFLFFYSKLLNV